MNKNGFRQVESLKKNTQANIIIYVVLDDMLMFNEMKQRFCSIN